MHSGMLLGAVLAVGAVAVPLEGRDVKIVDVVDTVTVTITAGHGAPTPPASNNGGGFLEGHNQPVPVPVPAPAPKPNPPPSSGSQSNIPTSGGVSLLTTANKWRAKYGLNELSWNHAMDANCEQVGQNGGGVQEIHELIPEMAMGQVITPAQANPVPQDQSGYTPFEVAYLAWLCEVPTDPQLQPDANGGIDPCQVVQNTLHMEYTDRGHHDILVDPSYTSISCAYTANPNANQYTATYQGLYVCDLSS